MMCCGGYEILDHREGDLICAICGKTEQHLSNEIFISQKNEEHEFIQDICANNHIVKAIEHETINLINKGSMTNKKKNSFAAHCLYLACKKHGAGRTLFEISKMCFISSSEISHYNDLSDIELDPCQLCARTCEKLDLSDFILVNRIEKLSTQLYKNLLRCSPPQSALAVAIFLTTQQSNLTVVQIANACGISSSSLRRLCKVYNKELNEIMSLLPSHLSSEPVYYNKKNDKN